MTRARITPVAEGTQTKKRVDTEFIRNQLKELTPEQFVNHHILDRVPDIFVDRVQYVEWKGELARGLDVDPYSLLVVGSSCVGVSLSPKKLFNRFHRGSDIDVAIVSSYHFDIAWRWLRSLGPAQNMVMTDFERDMFKWHRNNLIFDGTIATEQLLSHLPFGAKWTSALGKARTRNPTRGHEVKARIYRDFESLRSYHEKNIRKLKIELSTSGTTGGLRTTASN
ncbi:hypothetical protein [Streptomyces shenzhenensis]|uniref:hypothetical protein n=1 Tax=Streptomyces shenzhenensis TaxID=943815 RepID=UPI0015F083DA|nr:hypothetical protein [Streptomyces shenzhenensis]